MWSPHPSFMGSKSLGIRMFFPFLGFGTRTGPGTSNGKDTVRQVADELRVKHERS